MKISVITALEKAKDEALAALPSPSPALFGLTAEQLEDYKNQIQDATTEAEVEAIMEEVNEYEAPALSGTWAILNATNGLYLGDAVLSAESKSAKFEKANGGFYIKVEDKYINMKGNNNWSMSADATAKTAWSFTLADGKYTIQGPNGLIGTDATTAGSAVYGDKGVANNGYWLIVDLEAAAIESAKGALQEAINAIPVPTANIDGSSTNIITWNKESVDAIKTALETAQDVLDNSTSVDDVNAQKEALEDLDTDIEVVNNIVEGTPYNVIMAKEGLGWSGNAVTFTYSEGNQNHYAMAYSDKRGATNYNQTIFFGKNLDEDYIIYTIDAEGKSWYVTDGTHVGSTVAWAGSQIRMTDVEDDAMPIEIQPAMDVEDIVEIVNIWTGEHIGSTNNNGFYCSNDNFALTIKEAASHTVTVNTSHKYATVIIPAETDIPEGVKLYTIEGIGDNTKTLVLTKETDKVKANVPYIVESETLSECEFTFIANAFKSVYEGNMLVGVYTDTPAPEGSYVLQKQGENENEKVGFFKVKSDKPTVKPNHAYLNVPESGVKAFYFDSETAIQAIEALTSGKAQIFDINGRQLERLQKGINIVNGKKIMVK